MRKRVSLIFTLLLLAVTSSSLVVEAHGQTLDLMDFGAAGDGLTDDGPALQSALDSLAEAGGGTLFVPEGRYAIITPVSKDFSGLASSISIIGVESDTPIDNTGGGQILSTGLGLKSEFFPQTGQTDIALRVSGLETFLIKDVAFVGTPAVSTDALVTLALDEIEDATILHCEFYGLSSQVVGGAIVKANLSRLKIEQTKFLGSTGNTGVYVPVVQNQRWKSIAVIDSTFVDYGQRSELFSKTGLAAPLSWINIGNAEAATPGSPRREVFISNVFLDEGGLVGVYAVPHLFTPESAPIDLVYITGLRMNVSNLESSGNAFTNTTAVLIEKSLYEWSLIAYGAISLNNVGTAILDKVECLASANRISADAGTERLSVINSTYTHLDSLAVTTEVINTETDEEDPVQYVRQQFEAVLGRRQPDPAAHFFWSDLILRCGDDAQCLADARAGLNAYLSGNPQVNFSITGQVTDENGEALAGATLSLSGSQSVSMQTGADGRYHFTGLPTSGNYRVTATKAHYTFDQPSQSFSTPGADETLDFTAALNRYQIAGRAVDSSNRAMPGVTVTLTGAEYLTATTDADGYFVFEGLKALESYIVTPTVRHYTFQSSAQTFDELDGDEALTFVGVQNIHSIGGRVTMADGTPFAGVGIFSTGSASGNTATDADGRFNCSPLPAGGNYTLTPAKAHYVFDPPSRTFTDLGANDEANFTAHLARYTLSGRVASGGTGLSGVTVELSGSETGTVVTDAAGNYTFNVTALGDYVITVTKTHYTFSPASVTFDSLDGNTLTDFTATLNRHIIGGRVTKSDGAGFYGVTVTLSGAQAATATTDNNGDYSFPNLPAGGNYTVSVSETHYSFEPSTRTFSDLSGDESAAFVGTLNTHKISGQVTRADGAGFYGVSVSLSGAQAGATTTDAGGNYMFSDLPAGGSYTVAVSRINYTFSPPSLTVSDLGSDQAFNFSGSPVSYQISGRVTLNGAAMRDVTVALGGSQNASVTTGADGTYSFTAAAESAYTLAASKTNYTFSPASLTVGNLVGNTAGDFTAKFNAGVPVLISAANSTRALAFDSVLQTREPFQLSYSIPWAADRRTRVMLFATNFDLAAGDTAAAVTAEAEDASQRIYTLTVEYVDEVPGFDWLKCIVVRLSDNLGDVGDVLVKVSYKGISSNRVRLGIGHVGGGPPDDLDSVPTPGQSP